MKDLVFLDAFYWLFMNRDFIIVATSTLTFIAVLISIIYILKNWGEVK
jgi:hypothetical protein